MKMVNEYIDGVQFTVERKPYGGFAYYVDGNWTPRCKFEAAMAKATTAVPTVRGLLTELAVDATGTGCLDD